MSRERWLRGEDEAVAFDWQRPARWIATGPGGALELDIAFSGGRCLVRGSATTVAGSKVTVVFRTTGGGGWYILTGFPEP